MLTASQRALEINEVSHSAMHLVTDEHHWDDYGIYTGDELNAYLAWCEWSDLYRSVHGIKPRWTNWRDADAAHWEAEIRHDIDALNEAADIEDREAAWHASELAAAKAPQIPLVWTPFAGLSLK